MTSSRCCKKIDIDLEAEVVAGDVSPFDGVEKPSTQRRNISSILLHADVGVKDGSSQTSLPSASSAFSDVDSGPLFRDVSFGADVCVVTLDVPLVIDGEFVDVIDIIEDKTQPEVGTTCEVVNWGSAQKQNVRVSQASSLTHKVLLAETMLQNLRAISHAAAL